MPGYYSQRGGTAGARPGHGLGTAGARPGHGRGTAWARPGHGPHFQTFPFPLLCVLFMCKYVMYCCHRGSTECVMYCCHRVSTQLRLNISYITVQEVGWAPGPVWTCANNLAPTGIRSPVHSARSQSLYRLSYPGPYS
jgi:hypothetical protein